jgi:hypothetical protein
MVSDRLHIPRRVLAGAFGLAVLGVCGLGLHALAGAQEARSREAAPRAQATIRPTVFDMPQPGAPAYRLHAFRVPLARTRLDIVDTGMNRGLEAVLRDSGATLVVNGGFFGVRGEPEGLAVSGGRVLSPLLARIGGGVLTERAGIARLFAAETPPAPDDADFAVQCRPRLVVENTVTIRSDAGRHADRTALCVRDGGAVLEVIVARSDDDDGRDGPTLFTLARLLAARGCEQALNLDGGPSTGAAWRDPRGVRVLPPRGPVRHAVVFTLDAGRE